MKENPGLAAIAEQIRPTLLRVEQRLEIGGALSPLFPLGGPALGSSISVEGPGATSLVMSLIATPTAMGVWVAVVGVDQWGWSAAVAAGVDPTRTVAIQQPTPDRWGAVFGALAGSFGVVVLDAAQPVSAADARRLDARRREHGTVVIGVATPSRPNRWPASADVALTLSAAHWSGIDNGHGHLGARTVTVRIGGRRHGGQQEVLMGLPSSTASVELFPSESPPPRLRRVV